MTSLEQATTHNPYTPPNSPATDFKSPENSFLFIWLWLPFASVGSFLISPAAIQSILITTILALIYFLLGVIIAIADSWLKKLLWIVIYAWVTWAFIAPAPIRQSLLDLAFFACNVLFGVKSCRDIRQRRGVIFATLAACYIGGMLFIPIGVLLTCVPGILTVEAKTRHRDTPYPTNEEIPQ